MEEQKKKRSSKRSSILRVNVPTYEPEETDKHEASSRASRTSKRNSKRVSFSENQSTKFFVKDSDISYGNSTDDSKNNIGNTTLYFLSNDMEQTMLSESNKENESTSRCFSHFANNFNDSGSGDTSEINCDTYDVPFQLNLQNKTLVCNDSASNMDITSDVDQLTLSINQTASFDSNDKENTSFHESVNRDDVFSSKLALALLKKGKDISSEYDVKSKASLNESVNQDYIFSSESALALLKKRKDISSESYVKSKPSLNESVNQDDMLFDIKSASTLVKVKDQTSSSATIKSTTSIASSSNSQKQKDAVVGIFSKTNETKLFSDFRTLSQGSEIQLLPAQFLMSGASRGRMNLTNDSNEDDLEMSKISAVCSPKGDSLIDISSTISAGNYGDTPSFILEMNKLNTEDDLRETPASSTKLFTNHSLSPLKLLSLKGELFSQKAVAGVSAKVLSPNFPKSSDELDKIERSNDELSKLTGLEEVSSFTDYIKKYGKVNHKDTTHNVPSVSSENVYKVNVTESNNSSFHQSSVDLSKTSVVHNEFADITHVPEHFDKSMNASVVVTKSNTTVPIMISECTKKQNNSPLISDGRSVRITSLPSREEQLLENVDDLILQKTEKDEKFSIVQTRAAYFIENSETQVTTTTLRQNDVTHETNTIGDDEKKSKIIIDDISHTDVTASCVQNTNQNAPFFVSMLSNEESKEMKAKEACGIIPVKVSDSETELNKTYQLKSTEVSGNNLLREEERKRKKDRRGTYTISKKNKTLCGFEETIVSTDTNWLDDGDTELLKNQMLLKSPIAYSSILESKKDDYGLLTDEDNEGDNDDVDNAVSTSLVCEEVEPILGATKESSSKNASVKPDTRIYEMANASKNSQSEIVADLEEASQSFSQPTRRRSSLRLKKKKYDVKTLVTPTKVRTPYKEGINEVVERCPSSSQVDASNTKDSRLPTSFLSRSLKRSEINQADTKDEVKNSDEDFALDQDPFTPRPKIPRDTPPTVTVKERKELTPTQTNTAEGASLVALKKPHQHTAPLISVIQRLLENNRSNDKWTVEEISCNSCRVAFLKYKFHKLIVHFNDDVIEDIELSNNCPIVEARWCTNEKYMMDLFYKILNPEKLKKEYQNTKNIIPLFDKVESKAMAWKSIVLDIYKSFYKFLGDVHLFENKIKVEFIVSARKTKSVFNLYLEYNPEDEQPVLKSYLQHKAIYMIIHQAHKAVFLGEPSKTFSLFHHIQQINNFIKDIENDTIKLQPDPVLSDEEVVIPVHIY